MAREQKSYYAVDLRAQGGGTHIVTCWEECSALVKGVSRARYKRLKTLDEAKSYLDLARSSNPHAKLPPPTVLPEFLDLAGDHNWNVYTDGSYIEGIAASAWGWSLICDDLQLIGDRLGISTQWLREKNIGAELEASLDAVRTLESFVMKCKAKVTITIHHDYLGVSEWALKRWQARSDIAKWYQQQILGKLTWIRFEKVTAHGANIWNDRIDKLVRQKLRQHR